MKLLVLAAVGVLTLAGGSDSGYQATQHSQDPAAPVQSGYSPGGSNLSQPTNAPTPRFPIYSVPHYTGTPEDASQTEESAPARRVVPVIPRNITDGGGYKHCSDYGSSISCNGDTGYTHCSDYGSSISCNGDTGYTHCSDYGSSISCNGDGGYTHCSDYGSSISCNGDGGYTHCSDYGSSTSCYSSP